MTGVYILERIWMNSPLLDAHTEVRATLVRLGSLLTGSRSTAEELADDLIARTYGRTDLVEMRRYLVVAMSNSCRSYHRSQSRRRQIEEQLLAIDPAPRGLETLIEFRDMLMRLSHAQRTSVVLRYQFGYSDAEIAETLSCREATVRSHVRRALYRLRMEMSDGYKI